MKLNCLNPISHSTAIGRRRWPIFRSHGWCWLIVFAFAAATVNGQDQLRAVQKEYSQTIRPLLETACRDCHSGESAEAGFDLDAFQTLDQLLKARKKWLKVEQRIEAKEMPPADAEPLSDTDHATVIAWLDQLLHHIDCTEVDPGRVTLRRLNRTEYQNTVRDLLDIDYHPAKDFPGDDEGYGFDNIADVISLPPSLMEQYLTAAEEISSRAIDVMPPSKQRLFDDAVPSDQESQRKIAQATVTRFATRAFRRPVTDDEVNKLLELYEMARSDGDAFEQAMRMPLTAILVSPHFLYKIERPVAIGETRDLNDFEIATSLSYFLWSSTPDETLMRLAADEKLHDQKIYQEQIERMLVDPKAAALVDNFAAQWLQLKPLETLQPDPDLFPGIDLPMRRAMITETKMLFADLLKRDTKVTDLLATDYTFVNQRLARLYGIKGVTGEKFQRVSTESNGRRGLMTHASILTLTSNPTRTSPVKRGKWIMENLLGEKPPPPDPAAMALEDQAELTGTMRQRMEQHRADPNCAVCHRVMDELGFALEQYDAVGRWREEEDGQPIDASGKLPDGTTFAGAAQMQTIIQTTMRDQFVRCLTEKMLIYATGRGLEYYDECELDKITKRLHDNDFRFSQLIIGVATSAPFLKRSGEAK